MIDLTALYIIVGIFCGVIAIVLYASAQVIRHLMEVIRSMDVPAPPPAPAPVPIISPPMELLFDPIELTKAIGDVVRDSLYGPQAKPTLAPMSEPNVPDMDFGEDDDELYEPDPLDDEISDEFIASFRQMPPTPIPEGGVVSGQTFNTTPKDPT